MKSIFKNVLTLGLAVLLVMGIFAGCGKTGDLTVTTTEPDVTQTVVADGPKYLQNLAFKEGTTEAYCPGCDKDVTWTAMVNAAYSIEESGHFYLTEDMTFNGPEGTTQAMKLFGGATACIHLNGHTYTTSHRIYAESGVLNIYSGDGGQIFFNKNEKKVGFTHGDAGIKYNLYGGTYTYPFETTEERVIFNFGEINLYDATVVGNVYHRGGDSSVNLYGSSTVTGSHIFHQGSTRVFGKIVLKDGWNGKLILTEAEAKMTVVEGETLAGTVINAAGMGFVKIGTELKPGYTQNLTFTEGTTEAYCPGCNALQTWAPLGSDSYAIDGDTHCYLADDLTFTATEEVVDFVKLSGGATLCLHLNGHTLTNGGRFLALSGVLNIYSGDGGKIDFQANAKKVAFTHGDAGITYNLCGGTYTYPCETEEDRIIFNFGEINLYDATVNGTVYHRGGDSSVNLYGSSTINGTHIFHQGSTRIFGQIVLMNGWDGSLTLTDEEIAKVIVMGENLRGTITDKAGKAYVQDGTALKQGTPAE